jgi:glycine/D-amino acid oxidase-like deaminating enzyme
MVNDIPVAIVGGGFAGVSAAYQLSKLGIESLVIEAGKIGEGNDEFPAGTLSPSKPEFSKWITHAFDSNYEEFSKMHGNEGAKTFLELTSVGTEIIRTIIKFYQPEIIREFGSLVIAEDEKQWQNLQLEHEHYKKLGFGFDYKRLSKAEVNKELDVETSFVGALSIPSGAMINQKECIKLLVRLSSRYSTLGEYTKVVNIEENSVGVKLTTNSGEKITADQVVIATNGFYQDKNLQALLEPRFTFIRGYEDKGKNTSGCWTFGEKYFYFTRQDNILLVGGLDISVNPDSSFKIDETPHMQTLQEYANRNFQAAKIRNLVCTHFGVYSKTRDELPIVGKFNDESRISYILGCNAIGHTTYNVASDLMPGILGYRDLNPQQKKFANFLSPKRKTLSG